MGMFFIYLHIFIKYVFVTIQLDATFSKLYDRNPPSDSTFTAQECIHMKSLDIGFIIFQMLEMEK